MADSLFPRVTSPAPVPRANAGDGERALPEVGEGAPPDELARENVRPTAPAPTFEVKPISLEVEQLKRQLAEMERQAKLARDERDEARSDNAGLQLEVQRLVEKSQENDALWLERLKETEALLDDGKSLRVATTVHDRLGALVVTPSLSTPGAYVVSQSPSGLMVPGTGSLSRFGAGEVLRYLNDLGVDWSGPGEQVAERFKALTAEKREEVRLRLEEIAAKNPPEFNTSDPKLRAAMDAEVARRLLAATEEAAAAERALWKRWLQASPLKNEVPRG